MDDSPHCSWQAHAAPQSEVSVLRLGEESRLRPHLAAWRQLLGQSGRTNGHDTQAVTDSQPSVIILALQRRLTDCCGRPERLPNANSSAISPSLERLRP